MTLTQRPVIKGGPSLPSMAFQALPYLQSPNQKLASKADNIPTTGTDNRAVRFDGTTGKMQNSVIVVDDSGNVTGVLSLVANDGLRIGNYAGGPTVCKTGDMLMMLGGTVGFQFQKQDGGAVFGSIANSDGAFSWAGKWGVHGATPPAKPTVTGSKGANAALTSLMTALASYGLVTDSTS